MCVLVGELVSSLTNCLAFDLDRKHKFVLWKTIVCVTVVCGTFENVLGHNRYVCEDLELDLLWDHGEIPFGPVTSTWDVHFGVGGVLLFDLFFCFHFSVQKVPAKTRTHFMKIFRSAKSKLPD